MPNPSDNGTFEQWITDRLDFTTGMPRVGDSGDMEQWITDRLDFAEYQEVTAVGIIMPIFSTKGIHSVIHGGQIVR